MREIHKIKIKKYLAGFAAVFVLSALSLYPQLEIRGKLKVSFFNVGQGDAILIETPGGDDILVDGGPSTKIIQKLGKELSFFDRGIELLILTHPHADHLSGLPEVLKRYEIKRVLSSGEENKNSLFGEWEKFLNLEKTDEETAEAGNEFQIGGVGIKMLWPDGNTEPKDLNDNSVAFILSYGKNNFIFTGDIPSEAEREILKDYDFADLSGIKILKVAHHGSKGSSSEEFLQAVKPDFAIISVGKNSYNLPSDVAIQRIQKYTDKIFRTDENGDVAFICDETTCEVKTK